jgi:7-keto-8-aminopelargonate synthetase-like enzyme
MEGLTQELAALESRSLRRRLQVVEEVLPGGKVRVAGQVLLNLSSNDYLGLSQDPRIIEAARAAAARWGAGAGASRLVMGHWPCTKQWKPAAFKGAAEAAIFHWLHGQWGTIAALWGQGCDFQ